MLAHALIAIDCHACLLPRTCIQIAASLQGVVDEAALDLGSSCAVRVDGREGIEAPGPSSSRTGSDVSPPGFTPDEEPLREREGLGAEAALDRVEGCVGSTLAASAQGGGAADTLGKLERCLEALNQEATLRCAIQESLTLDSTPSQIKVRS